MRFIIEHMDDKLYKWSFIEYKHVSKIVGVGNLIFTNVESRNDALKLKKYGDVFSKSLSKLNNELRLNNKICVLSQYACHELSSNDSRKFNYFVFGGILGDNPARNRTNLIIEQLKKQKIRFEQRNLGKIQMPTDVAVYVTKKILDGAKIHEIRFCDKVEVEINENESVDLDFRYVIDNNKLVISKELIGYLRNMKKF